MTSSDITDFRIGTFNLENLEDGPHIDPPLAQRLPILRPQLQRMRADVLCLQEVNAQKIGSGPRTLRALDRLLEDTPYSTYHRACSHAQRGDGLLDKHNLVVLSRFPITMARQYWHDLVPPPSYPLQTAVPPELEPHSVTWDRPLLYAEIAPPGAPPLHLFNLHLRAPLAALIPGQKAAPFEWKSVPGWAEGYTLAAIKRIGQALEARLAIDQVFDQESGALVAVCGDFNADDYEAPSRLLRAEEQDTGNGELAYRSLIALERRLSPSRRFTVVHHGRPQMLDHILVSREILGWHRELEIHNEDLGDEMVAVRDVRHAPDSFHAPIVASFSRPV
jgi:endonuclease/exonuclease/phosphatase family metal-dependent hydrolase